MREYLIRTQGKRNSKKIKSGILKGEDRFGDKIISKDNIKAISYDDNFSCIYLSITP
jgi:hypothetical protein